MPYKSPSQTPATPVSSFKKITLGFVVIVVILLVFIVYFSFAKATITLTLGNESKSQEIDLIVSATSTEGDLPGQIITKEITVEQKFEVASFEEKPGIATGKIRIINNNTDSQQLIKTTRFLTADGLLFRLKDNVSVPAGKDITAEIYADATGEKYNIGPTKFTIPGLEKSLQTKIYGQTDEATSGGVQKIGVLTNNDIELARQKFQDNLKQNVKAQLLNDLSGGQKILDNLLKTEVKEENIKEKVGEKVANFTITAKVAVQAIAINEDQLINAGKEKYKQALLNLGLQDKISNWQTENLTVDLKSFDNQKMNATLAIKLTADIGSSFDQSKFDKKEIAGFDKKGVEYYFSQFAGIKNVEIKFWPFWVKSVPAVSDRISVEVK